MQSAGRHLSIQHADRGERRRFLDLRDNAIEDAYPHDRRDVLQKKEGIIALLRPIKPSVLPATKNNSELFLLRLTFQIVSARRFYSFEVPNSKF